MFITTKIVSFGQRGLADRHMHTALGAFHHVLVGFDGLGRLLDAGLATPRVALDDGKRDNA